MIFKVTSLDERNRRMWQRRKGWNRCFAWRPVRVADDKVAWLCFVYRQARDRDGRAPWDYKLETDLVVERLTSEK